MAQILSAKPMPNFELDQYVLHQLREKLGMLLKPISMVWKYGPVKKPNRSRSVTWVLHTN